MPPAPSLAADPAPTPVFVDDTGRRHRAVRVVGWCLGAVMVGYLALLAVSLVGSPGLVPLSLPSLGRLLPGPAAPLVAEPAHAPASTGDLVSAAVPSPTTIPAARVATPRATTTTRPKTRVRTLPTATSRPAATPTATPAPASTTQPSAQPTARATRRPSTHPSPRNTKRSTPLTSPTPTATAT